MSVKQLALLRTYEACDISDALLKLKVTDLKGRTLGGFLDGLAPYRAKGMIERKIVAPACTVQFQPKDKINGVPALPKAAASNIETGAHWSDLTEKDTVVVIQQPEGQQCAVVGGIMAQRMTVRGVAGVIVSGKIRDLQEMFTLKLPIWARSTSTVGSGAEAEAYAIQVPVRVGDTEIKPGDIMFCDPDEGVVAIPQERLQEVLDILPSLIEADDKVKEAVGKGMSVQEAFATFRTPKKA